MTPFFDYIILLLLFEGDHEGLDLGQIINYAFIRDTLINRSTHD